MNSSKHIKFERPGPKVRAAEIAKFEREIGFKLPADYRKFLLVHNGGKPCPDNFKQVVGDKIIVNWVQRFYSLEASGGLRMEWWEARREFPPGWIPIGSDCGGEALCICLNKKGYGVIAVTDGYAEYLGRPPEMRQLADSFTTFLAMLFDQRALEPVDTPYELSASGTKEDLLRYLASEGKVSDKTRLGGTVTESAAAHGNLEVLKACLELGGEIAGCLTLAAMNCEWEAIRFLVEAGADVNEIDPRTGKTPVELIPGYWANGTPQGKDVIAFLRRHGAKK
jgi:cell wall assembly regulator SMI1